MTNYELKQDICKQLKEQMKKLKKLLEELYKISY